ncbi:hypothetical protein NPIL_630691, partial [Nephila pilipes]
NALPRDQYYQQRCEFSTITVPSASGDGKRPARSDRRLFGSCVASRNPVHTEDSNATISHDVPYDLLIYRTDHPRRWKQAQPNLRLDLQVLYATLRFSPCRQCFLGLRD